MSHVLHESGAKQSAGAKQGLCPVQDSTVQCPALDADTVLFLPKHKSVIAQYSTDGDGAPELNLYYGDKEIQFDDPALFGFGEMLAKQSRFVAREATGWGSGYEWPQVRELLQQLVEEGILRPASDHDEDRAGVTTYCPSPLPPAESPIARSWTECERLSEELTGRSVELGYLESIVPVFRIAHIVVDAEGRQVGEANVFPSPLRIDVPTDWRKCPHAGSRAAVDRPMNVTALKSMRAHWTPMLLVLQRIRAAYLQRFPEARHGWTVGHLQRLSALVLSVPAYLLMRADHPVANGTLHPVLSSLFRLTDGVRMTMHQMLFYPFGEPTLPPDQPMNSKELYDYAERNYLFVSKYAVCAGPKNLIEEFLSVLVDGQPVTDADAVILAPEIEETLRELDKALDYGLLSLQAHAIVFGFWPMMCRTYLKLWDVVQAWPEAGSGPRVDLRKRLRTCVELLSKTPLATEEWRLSRERVYADMYTQCGIGLGQAISSTALADRLTAVVIAPEPITSAKPRSVLEQALRGTDTATDPTIDATVHLLLGYLNQEQAAIAATHEVQVRINQLLRRKPPIRPLNMSDLEIYDRLEPSKRRLPYLVHELEAVLGIRITVTNDDIEITEDRRCASQSSHEHYESDQHGVGQSTCDGHG